MRFQLMFLQGRRRKKVKTEASILMMTILSFLYFFILWLFVPWYMFIEAGLSLAAYKYVINCSGSMSNSLFIRHSWLPFPTCTFFFLYIVSNFYVGVCFDTCFLLLAHLDLGIIHLWIQDMKELNIEIEIEVPNKLLKSMYDILFICLCDVMSKNLCSNLLP